MTDDDRLPTTYEAAGMAAMLPGMVHTLTILQGEIDRIKAMLGMNGFVPTPKMGRPLGSKNNTGAPTKRGPNRKPNTYWSKMTPEERTAEMQKRAVAAGRQLRTPMLETNKVSNGQKTYWAKFTPEERANEMKRRISMRSLKKGIAPKGMHPRDPAHPGHAAWLKKMSKVGRRSWASLTPEQHAARVAKTLAGRTAA